MRKIDVQQLITLSDSYTGKEVQVSLSPIQSQNIYKQFKCRDIGNSIEFYEISFDKPSAHELLINKEDIVEIQYFEDDNIYNTVFSIMLNQGQVDFTISEKPLNCRKCGKLLDKYFDQCWVIDQVGVYGSQWDNQKVSIELCEDCLMEFLEYENKEKTCH